MLGVVQLIKRLVDVGLVAEPPVGALTTVDWACAGWEPKTAATTHDVAPATPAIPKSEAAIRTAT